MTSSPEESPESVVRHATDNDVAWITLDRPAAMNAITPDQRERLISLLDDASADPAVGAVVITATGKGFCAGADLRGGARTGAGGGAGGSAAGDERVAGDVARLIRR
ncbi:enoyl-CoA hydratase/isomerase family protein, partial [Streptomyces sp. MCAF7]